MAKSKKTIAVDRWVRRNQGQHYCQCGCDEPVEIKREHHKASVGIPKFLKGHNLKLEPEELLEIEEYAKASVWETLTQEERDRRLSLLKSFGRGEDNPAWIGGRRIDDHGYVQVRMPDHPHAKDGYFYEHRLVVEEHTRRNDPDNKLLIEIDGKKYLRRSAVVHHIDEVKTNNDISNLMLLPDQRFHAFIHKSHLPFEEKVRRIKMGIFHSGPIVEEDK